MLLHLSVVAAACCLTVFGTGTGTGTGTGKVRTVGRNIVHALRLNGLVFVKMHAHVVLVAPSVHPPLDANCIGTGTGTGTGMVAVLGWELQQTAVNTESCSGYQEHGLLHERGRMQDLGS